MAVKLCECGCGGAAPIAHQTEAAKGYVRGQPRRFIRGHAARGRTWTAEARAKRTGDRNPVWKGDAISYKGMHERARKALPRQCTYCDRKDGRLEVALRHDGSPSARRICPRLGIPYSVRIADYFRLCRSCHARYDGIGCVA